MRTEAHALKADGVVGVHLAIQQHAWGSGELEFVAQGTAVRDNVYNHIWGEHATEFLSVDTGVVTSPESGLPEPNMTLSLSG
jgi:hypothetical protein